MNNATEHLTEITDANISHSMQQPKENANKLEVISDIATEEIIKTHHEEHYASGLEDNGNSSLDEINDEKGVTSSQVIFYVI